MYDLIITYSLFWLLHIFTLRNTPYTVISIEDVIKNMIFKGVLEGCIDEFLIHMLATNHHIICICFLSTLHTLPFSKYNYMINNIYFDLLYSPILYILMTYLSTMPLEMAITLHVSYNLLTQILYYASFYRVFTQNQIDEFRENTLDN